MGTSSATPAGWTRPTRREALAKLASFDPRIGHPVKYIDYSRMRVTRADPLANIMASGDFEWKLELSRLGKPVDRSLWDMNVQEVNAYYNPLMNQVTFPAAILQPPFFDPAADPAVNYGETGATIGHEMGHGFDDEGRQFDARGRLRDWWTKESAERYTSHAQALVKQFDAYEPIPGVHIKGQLTLGENLGDLGGLEAAYAAYRRYVARHGEPPVIDGYTGDQRFFIAYAQSWQGKAREGALEVPAPLQPAQPGGISGERHRPQHGRLVRRLRRQARRQALSAARAEGSRLDELTEAATDSRRSGDYRDSMTSPLSILRETFGFAAFRGVQEQVIDRVMAGEHTLAVMPTGSGKSLCYQVPALAREGTALVISPLIALMHDQIRSARAFGIRAASLTSADEDRQETLARLKRGELDLLYVAPERASTSRLPRAGRAHEAGADRDRRGALRLRMGPRFPARLPAAQAAARRLSRRAAPRPHRHRRQGDPRRHPRPARNPGARA
jgi:hypothetical protein